MNIDKQRFRHFHQICLLAIGSNHLPLSMFQPYVQLTGDFFTQYSNLRSPSDDDGKLVPMDLSCNSSSGPEILQL